MLEFTCPACGKRVQGDDASAGQRVQCPACNTTMVAPVAITAQAPRIAAVGDAGFREGDPPQTLPLPKEMPGILARYTPLCVVLAMCATGALLLIPVIRKSREAAARAESINHLKNIGLAMHGFHDANRRLPFNGAKAAIAGDRTSGSWAFQILPFVDHAVLFFGPDTITAVPTYMCPGRGRPAASNAGAWTDYFINPWINDPEGRVNAPDVKRTLVGITDGTSNTIFAGQGNIDPDAYSASGMMMQTTDIFQGGDMRLARRSTTNQRDRTGDAALNWGGPFADGCLFGMGDGTVRTFPYRMTGGTIIDGSAMNTGGDGCFAWFLTPNGGEIGWGAGRFD